MAGSHSYLLPADSQTPADDPAIVAFFVLLILGGNVLMPIMVIVTFVRGNHFTRSPIFINFCVGWIVYSIGFLLSFYSGRWKRDLEPIPWLCEFQAILAYVLPVWVSATTTALVFELWLGVSGRASGSSADQDPQTRLPLRTIMLLAFPYLCSLFMGVSTSLVSTARPDLVGFTAIFCSVDFQPLRTTTSVICALATLLGFGLQFDIGRRFYAARGFGTTRPQDWSLFIRMLVFLMILGIGGLAAIFAGTQSYKYPRQVIQALFPLAAWLVFGTNPAIYKRDSGPNPDSKA